MILHLLFEAGVLQHFFLHSPHDNVEQILKQLGGDEDVGQLPRLLGSPLVDVEVNLHVEDDEVLQRVQLILLSGVEERQFVKLFPGETPGVDEVNHLLQGVVIQVLDGGLSGLTFSHVGLEHGLEDTGPGSEDQLVDSKALGVCLQSEVGGILIIQQLGKIFCQIFGRLLHDVFVRFTNQDPMFTVKSGEVVARNPGFLDNVFFKKFLPFILRHIFVIVTLLHFHEGSFILVPIVTIYTDTLRVRHCSLVTTDLNRISKVRYDLNTKYLERERIN